MVQESTVLEKIDIPIDWNLAGLLQQSVAALQDVPEAANDLLLLLTLFMGVSLLAGFVRSPLQAVQECISSRG